MPTPQPLKHPPPPPPSPSLHLRESEHDMGSAPNILERLREIERCRVNGFATRIQFQPGETVFRQGDIHQGIYIIEAGMVRSYYTVPSGREITLAYWSPGNFVGGPEVFGGSPHLWSGTAEQPTRVLQLNGPHLRSLIETIPAFALALFEALVHKGKCYSALIQMLGTRSVAQRLAQLLLLIAQFDGARRPDGGIFIIRTLTHEEIAKMVGATRQWVTTTLDRFRGQGLIDLQKHQIVIRDEARLRQFSG
jgi:CRP/FNR family transcriptional regulator, cyclic AMP receptor protein